MSCAHHNFKVDAKIARLTKAGQEPARNFSAEITIICADCKCPFHFVGLNAGSSFEMPTVNMNSTELRAPIVPGSGPLLHNATYQLKERS